ncbi:serine/threonine-protein phosphatase 7 long form homolog [Elaeis guineensis]|uniref:serine/threonine-protein phosphatase 7 long form homolog n=1 Tax=Elaeis guineensis var. tenera TaxID=51953 RepID=UPI003C6D716B
MVGPAPAPAGGGPAPRWPGRAPRPDGGPQPLASPGGGPRVSTRIMAYDPRYPDPRDSSILTLQEHHRSQTILDGGESRHLRLRRSDADFWRTEDIPDRVLDYLRYLRFYGVYRIGRIQMDVGLITAMLERWRPETHTFHLPFGEATISLQDVSILTGLPVDGDPVTGVDPTLTIPEWQALCLRLLGFEPDAHFFDHSRLRIECLDDRYRHFHIADDAPEEMVQQYVRGQVLRLLGGVLLPDTSSNKMKLMFLPLLEDLDFARRLSWGSAVLACLYRAMCRGSYADQSEIGGYLVLLQIWVWERMPTISPLRRQLLEMPSEQQDPDVPFRLDGPLRYRDREGDDGEEAAVVVGGSGGGQGLIGQSEIKKKVVEAAEEGWGLIGGSQELCPRHPRNKVLPFLSAGTACVCDKSFIRDLSEEKYHSDFYAETGLYLSRKGRIHLPSHVFTIGSSIDCFESCARGYITSLECFESCMVSNPTVDSREGKFFANDTTRLHD